MNRIFFILSVVFVVAGLGCSGEKKAKLYIPDTASISQPSETNVEEVAGVENSSVLYFKLGIAWESDESEVYSYIKTCALPPAAIAGSSQTCSLAIPELQLYYSKLQFKVGTLDRAACPFVSFTPYYYIRSTQEIVNTWDGQTSITCNTTPYAAGCVGGAGPAMLSNFGEQTGYYFVSAVSNEGNYPLESPNKKRQLGPTNTNLMVTNDIANPTAGQISSAPLPGGAYPAADAFEKVTGAGTWQDYTVDCKDMWGATTHRITIKISDQNTATSTGGSVDHFADWPF